MNSSIHTEETEIAPNELSIIAKGAGINFLGKISGGIIQYIYLIILARLLGATSFGLFVLGVTIIEFAGVISRIGLDGAVVKFVSLYNGVNDASRTKGVIIATLKYSFISALLIAAVLYILPQSLYMNLFNKIDLIEPLKLLAISLPFSALIVVALNSTQGFKTMNYTVYSQNLLNPACNILLFAIFFFTGFRLYSAVLSYNLSALITAATSIYFIIKVFPSIRKTVCIFETKKLFRFSVPFLGIMLLMSLIQWTDILILGHFRTSFEVGIYSAAAKTALLLNTILLSFSHIFSPIISELYSKNETKKLEHLFKTVTRWSYIVSLPVFLLMVLLSKEIMAIFGQKFIPASVPLIILAFAQLANAGTGPVTHILIMSGKQNLMVVNSLAICLVNIALNYLLVPLYGTVGAAIASGFSIALFNIIMLAEIQFSLTMHPYNIKFLKPTFLGITAFAISFIFKRFLPNLDVLLEFLLPTIPLLAIYAGLMYVTGMPDEDKTILVILKRKLSNLFS